MQKLLERKSYCTFNPTIVLAFGVSFVEGGLRCLPGNAVFARENLGI